MKMEVAVFHESISMSVRMHSSQHEMFLSSSLISPKADIKHSRSLISGVEVGKIKYPRQMYRTARPSSTTCFLADVAKEFKNFQVPRIPKPEADPKTVASIILGGGAGTRLFPLTRRRAKPAVPIGGCYRLIDVPMSNCINSGINKIYILTQFNSQSLNRHIYRTCNTGNGVNFGDGFIEVLVATQTPGESGKKWFQGTADAVRQFTWLFEDAKHRQIENILILSCDHLYRMDYMDFVQIDEMGQIRQFLEKPMDESLQSMKVETTRLGLSIQEARKNPYIASMGIYLFRTDVLLKLLRWNYPMANDFGSEIIPMAAKDYNAQAYVFNGYWEDIGTIKSFFDANLALTDQPPKFHFFDPLKPIFTSPPFLPPTKIENCQVKDSIVSHGCFLRGCSVEHSVVGIRSRLDHGVELRDTMMIGADYYQTEAEIAAYLAEGKVPIGVGRETKIMNSIIDKNARIGKNVVIANTDKVEEADRPSGGFYIRAG